MRTQLRSTRAIGSRDVEAKIGRGDFSMQGSGPKPSEGLRLLANETGSRQSCADASNIKLERAFAATIYRLDSALDSGIVRRNG